MQVLAPTYALWWTESEPPVRMDFSRSRGRGREPPSWKPALPWGPTPPHERGGRKVCEAICATHTFRKGGPGTTDFEKLLGKWDSIFLKTVDPTREKRIEAILGTLDTRSRAPLRVLDLGTGPGPLACRILKRFRGSRVLGVDSDPVLLRVGEQALSRYGSRIAWVLADLREKDWCSGLPAGSFDAAVSSLALHWLEEREIRSLYRDLRRLLRPEGLLVNGDFLPSQQTKKGLRGQGAEGDGDRRAETVNASVRAFKPKWARWWNALEKEPSLHSAFTERQIRMPGPIPPRRTSGPRIPVPLESHERGLRNAGFREIAVVWRDQNFRVLIGTR